MNSVIGTTFIGHPMKPQFQKATVRVEDKEHPASKALPPAWDRTDEWYSFDTSPRAPGVNIIATLDESTYDPGSFFGTKLAMGKDHPIVWSRCVGRGRALYSAMGHTAASYAEAENIMLLTGAIKWALKQEGPVCDAPPTLPGKLP
jgi:type 1 glutamine amidotransferase